MMTSVVWALCVHSFGSEPGGVDIGGGVVQVAWWFVLASLVLMDRAWVCRPLASSCVVARSAMTGRDDGVVQRRTRN
jgi:hypothetical protein